MMNVHFASFVEHAKAVAATRGLVWDLPLDERGVCQSGAWNLTLLTKGSSPTEICLRDFGGDAGAVQLLNSNPPPGPQREYSKGPLPLHWQDLLKACVVDHVFNRHNTATHIVNVARALRVLGTCSSSVKPWLLTPDDIDLAVRVGKALQPSGQLLVVLAGAIRDFLDANHLVDNAPLSRFLPIITAVGHRRPAKFTKSSDEVLSSLEQRKHAEKLPDGKAFWELVRIVFTEKPRSFLHTLIFAAVQVLILTGHRGGEAALIPLDWKRTEEFFDLHGTPAGKCAGISRCLQLRYFLDKPRAKGPNPAGVVEDLQPVPDMYEEILTALLDRIARLTAPLRRTLKSQIQTGRLLPRFEPTELVRAVELYTYVTGNPFVAELPEHVRAAYVEKCRSDYDPKVFQKLRDLCMQAIDGGNSLISAAAYNYFNHLSGLPSRNVDGKTWSAESRTNWANVYFKIGDVEDFLRSGKRTKLPDTMAIRLGDGGELAAWKLMFLMPKRALSDGRDEGLCDVTRYFSVGRADGRMLTHALSTGEKQTLFAVYGQNDEDRALRLNPHSLRHLLNTECFRLGLSDAIITKHFGRSSVAESHEYDHRSLAEYLDRVDLSQEIELMLGDNAATVARLIKAGKASGPIVEAYLRIQRTEGDAAAFEYLRVEADGFHATPYGHCINSFTVDPCPSDLECFNNCRHLTATGLPKVRSNLVLLKTKIEHAISDIKAKKTSSIGRNNQLEHAQTRLTAIDRILATPAGERVFPEGDDLSRPRTKKSVLDDEN